jgi:hypothetical protein
MKRLFIFLAAAMMAAGAMAQVVETTPQLVCISNTYYYGRTTMNSRQMLDWYAQQNCQAAYDQFAKGRKMAIAGWSCLGVGAALDLSLGACYIAALSSSKNAAKSPAKIIRYSSSEPILFTIVGMTATAFEIASIPLLVIGYKRMHTSVDVYNYACTTAQTQPYWTIQASDNGLGLALNF